MMARGGLLVVLAGAAAVAACSGGVDTGNAGAGGYVGHGASATSTTTASSATSSTSTTTTTASSTSSSGAGGAMCPPSNDTMLAVDRIYYGDTNFDDVPNPGNGWKQYGLNLDGLVSTATSTGLCLPQNNAPVKNVYPDGLNGIDNSFGKHLLPMFIGLDASFSTKANAALTNGDFTLLIKLGALGAAADQGPILTRVYGGAPLSKAPEFDTDDCWPVTAESVTNPADVESAKLSLATSTLTANHWDSVTSGDLDLPLKVAGFTVHLVIHHARLTMDLDAGHQNANTGIIAGVLDTEELVAALDQAFGSFDPSVCSGPTKDSIDAQIRQASDILKDTTQNPAKTCDGISIGLGFKAAKIGVGKVAPPMTPVPNPCGP